jgi:hypothetical protein
MTLKEFAKELENGVKAVALGDGRYAVLAVGPVGEEEGFKDVLYSDTEKNRFNGVVGKPYAMEMKLKDVEVEGADALIPSLSVTFMHDKRNYPFHPILKRSDVQEAQERKQILDIGEKLLAGFKKAHVEDDMDTLRAAKNDLVKAILGV